MSLHGVWCVEFGAGATIAFLWWGLVWREIGSHYVGVLLSAFGGTELSCGFPLVEERFLASLLGW